MSKLRLASLCSGTGGLDLAVIELLDAVTVWLAEFEDAPSRVLEARFHDVPNVRDVNRIPWWVMAPVDVVAAGYPCQPFSLAGARLGEEDPRHLWPSIAEGIRIMRPRHVMLENVRGHLSLGFDRVLHDLHMMGYAVTWRILSAAAVGACHRRERLWIYAQPAEFVLPVETPVLAVADSAGWREPFEDLFGYQGAWRGKIPTAGMMHTGEIRAVSMPSCIEADLLPTPKASDSHQAAPSDAERKSPGLRAVDVLLPTPDAYQGSRGGSQDPEKRRAGGHTVSLADVVEKGDDLTLLPTPKAGDASFGLPRTSGRPVEKSTHLATRVVYDLLPTPQAHDHVQGKTAEQVAAMRARTGAGVSNLNEVVQHGLLPTPRSSRGASSTEIAYALGAERSDEARTQGELVFTRPAEWGKYGPAVERHAAMLGREPGSPTQPNTKGNPELAPRFVEWMMCLPEGWVTDAPLDRELSPRGVREAQLRMLGNGVVPIAALTAYRTLAALAAGTRQAVAA